MRKYHKDGTLPPKDGTIFVFGSNLAGLHGAGAAKAALDYGAKYGHGFGACGSSWALPTKDDHLNTYDLKVIERFVERFIEEAKMYPDKNYFVTRVGCGLARYSDKQIAPLFLDAPKNCSFAEQWEPYLN